MKNNNYLFKVADVLVAEKIGKYYKIPMVVLVDRSNDKVIDVPALERWYSGSGNYFRARRKAKNIAHFLNFVLKTADAGEVVTTVPGLHKELFENFHQSKKCRTITRDIYLFLQEYYGSLKEGEIQNGGDSCEQ